MDFLMNNWQAILSILATILSIVVAILHIAHKDSVSQQVQAIEDIVNKIAKS